MALINGVASVLAGNNITAVEASILIANGGLSAIDAVQMVRLKHCQEAVESQSQCRYLMNIDGHYNNRKINQENYPMSSNMAGRMLRAALEGDEEEEKEKAIVNVSGIL